MSEKLTPGPSNHKISRSRSQSKKSSSPGKHLRLERLTLKNFKAFDELTIEFPRPDMEGEPDILVMGSKNGLGKTSIFEACSLLFLTALNENELTQFVSNPSNNIDGFFRAGTSMFRITGVFAIDTQLVDITLELFRDMPPLIEGNSPAIEELSQQIKLPRLSAAGAASRLSLLLNGLSSEPFMLPFLIYFHSYRKVQEGRLELGAMIENASTSARARQGRESETPLSAFKQEILRSLMSRGSLFEDLNVKDAEGILNTLNSLVERYAGGRIEKLRQSIDGIEFLVTPINNPAMSFNFDGLSSGQKEIISTLFLIWYYTRNQPGIVLIDEPELHLNPEWHRGIIQYLYQLAPQNQYIIATHSEDVFSAVDKDRRILLMPDAEEVR